MNVSPTNEATLPQPILIVGMGRSGTKGLTNEIGRHRDVAIVADDAHYGVMISPIFEVLPSKFNLKLTDEYIAAVAVLLQTDFIRHTGIDESFFFELKPRPKNFVDLFRAYMDEYARLSGKAFWVQKTSPRGVWMFPNQYKGFKLIIIQRDLVSNVRSRIANQMRSDKNFKKLPNLFRGVAHYVVDEKLNQAICKKMCVLLLSFEKYKSQTEQVKEEIAEFTGLPSEGFNFDPEYPRNTSFDGKIDREKVLTRFDLCFISAIYHTLRIFPLRLLYGIRERLMSRITPVGPGAFNGIHIRYNI